MNEPRLDGRRVGLLAVGAAGLLVALLLRIGASWMHRAGSLMSITAFLLAFAAGIAVGASLSRR